MKRKLSMSSLLVAGALAWVTGYAGTSTESHPGVGMGEASQQKSQESVISSITKISGVRFYGGFLLRRFPFLGNL